MIKFTQNDLEAMTVTELLSLAFGCLTEIMTRPEGFKEAARPYMTAAFGANEELLNCINSIEPSVTTESGAEIRISLALTAEKDDEDCYDEEEEKDDD